MGKPVKQLRSSTGFCAGCHSTLVEGTAIGGDSNIDVCTYTCTQSNPEGQCDDVACHDKIPTRQRCCALYTTHGSASSTPEMRLQRNIPIARMIGSHLTSCKDSVPGSQDTMHYLLKTGAPLQAHSFLWSRTRATSTCAGVARNSIVQHLGVTPEYTAVVLSHVRERTAGLSESCTCRRLL